MEIGVLATCRELGAAFVAFSPVARGFLTNIDLEPEAFADKDIRRGMPRFQRPHFDDNRDLLTEFRQTASDAGCTAAQLSLAWALSRGDHVHVIPGTTSAEHLEENVAAASLSLDADVIGKVDALFSPGSVSGGRYPEATQAEIDTEEFPAS